MHAVVATVTVAPGQVETARKALREQIVPRISAAPGFLKGYWSADPTGEQGSSFIVFASKEDAESAASAVRNVPRPPGVALVSVDVREVIVEA